jgi:molybdopterin/thiamine biosynthesis adenylyltransferase
LSTRRFERQARFAPLGEAGQARLAESRVLLVGCGALGGFLAQLLTRAGVGTLVIVDRDIVEESNLPRQVLFTDAHAAAGQAKVTAAAETLATIGGPTRVETHARHLDADLLPRVAEGAHLVLDGTDNLPTRYLMNDWSVREGVPWIYGAVVASGGLVMPVLPGVGPCLRCLFREPPPPGTLATCDTAGVLGPAVGAVASMQAGLALRLLAAPEGLAPGLVELDVWSGDTRRLELARDPECPCCGARDFPWLERPSGTEAVSLCGRNTVEVRPRGARPDLATIAARLTSSGVATQRLGPMLRFSADGQRVTLFPDGRALVEGTEDLGRALAVVDRWVGA